MRANRSIPDAAIIPELAYPDVREAAAWLCAAFGFAERLRIGDHRVQLTLGDGALVVTQRGNDGGEVRGHRIMVRIADADAHCARAEAHGARIVQRPTSHPFGERQYSAVDPGGHAWTFSQSIADVDPAEWGGELVDAAAGGRRAG
ncbi:MAG: VOC family protein [Longimicrobiaceae bacterium]